MEIFSIVLIVSIIGNFINDIKFIPNRFIPTIGAICGAGLCMAFSYYGLIEISGNMLDAAVTGIISGLSATGAHQMYTQFMHKN